MADKAAAKGNGTDKPKAKRNALGHFLKGADNPRVVSPDRSGIQKGGKHKITQVRELVLGALEAVGGQDYLEQLARSRKDRHLFVQLLLKTVPQEITGKDGGPIDMNLLNVARQGIANLSDVQLDQLFGLFKTMGVGEVLQLMGADADRTAVAEVPAGQAREPAEAQT